MTSCPLPKGVDSPSFYGAIALLDHLYWIIGSLIGALAGTLIPFSFEGVDFALTALFAVLLTDQVKKSKDWIPPLIGISVTILAIILVPSDYVLLAALAAGVAILMLIKRPFTSQESP